MRNRCNNINASNYKYYGGRGISVCKEWNDKNGFCNFYNWSKLNGYNEYVTIDRIDNNGDYCPNNCRWVTMDVQGHNKRARKNKLTLTHNGETKSVNEWAKYLGIDRHVIYQRIKKGWSVEKVLETPLDKSHGNRDQGRKSQK